jgi:hypothetical protein
VGDFNLKQQIPSFSLIALRAMAPLGVTIHRRGRPKLGCCDLSYVLPEGTWGTRLLLNVYGFSGGE